jgi:hypothetical protein
VQKIDLAKYFIDVPDGLLNTKSGETICLVGLPSKPSSPTNLRIHGSWNNLSNYIEIPLDKVFAVYDASGRYPSGSKAVYVDTSARLGFSSDLVRRVPISEVSTVAGANKVSLAVTKLAQSSWLMRSFQPWIRLEHGNTSKSPCCVRRHASARWLSD